MSVDVRIKYPQSLLKIPHLRIEISVGNFTSYWSLLYHQISKIVSIEAIVSFFTLKMFIGLFLGHTPNVLIVSYLAFFILFPLRKLNDSKEFEGKPFKVDSSLAILSAVAYLFWSLGAAVFFIQCLLLTAALV